MRDLSFTPCRADGDMFMIVDFDTLELGAMTNYGIPAGEICYEHFLVNVEDIMVSSHTS